MIEFGPDFYHDRLSAVRDTAQYLPGGRELNTILQNS
jgi:hypothetical protein